MPGQQDRIAQRPGGMLPARGGPSFQWRTPWAHHRRCRAVSRRRTPWPAAGFSMYSIGCTPATGVFLKGPSRRRNAPIMRDRPLGVGQVDGRAAHAGDWGRCARGWRLGSGSGRTSYFGLKFLRTDMTSTSNRSIFVPCEGRTAPYPFMPGRTSADAHVGGRGSKSVIAGVSRQRRQAA